MEALALSASPQPRRLRVGVWADSRLQPLWVVDALSRLAAADFAEVLLVAAPERPAARENALWAAYRALDRRLFGAGPSERVDIAERLPRGEPRRLDVALALGALDDRALDGIARYGVWRFCFGPHGAEDERAAGVHEAAAGEPLTASGLKVRLAPGEPPRLACHSCSRTEVLSVARNRDHLCKTGEFVLRALRELHRSGPAWLQGCPQLAAAPPAPLPGARDALRMAARLARRAAEKALGVEQWSLAFAFNARVTPELAGFTRLVPPKDRDWADPFALEKDGRYYVFFEEVPFATRKGHIAMIEVDRAGRRSAPVTVLERDHHLSYPFLFEHEGALYMVPESARNRTVELWRCVDFPREWKLEKVLLEGVRLVDATLHRAHDRWWMFANCAPGASRFYDDELCLYWAERLTGEWQPHPRNPVKSDPRSSRPAGRLFVRDGALYRPAQVCVPRYGAGLALQRVLRLSPQEYAERQVERIVPAPRSGLLGLHTMNRAGDLVVVDAFARRGRI
ncbi:MAG TPA: hypothetical protein VF211_02670 [Burkholderiales bacterium]